MTPAVYRDLLKLARRHTRRADEAEDLVQDALLDAVAAGRADLADPANRRWLGGVIRNRAAFAARNAARRRRREQLWLAERPPVEPPVSPPDIAEVLRTLAPALKSLAALALSGHSRREIAYLLRLPDTALRQRIGALKRRLRALGLLMPGQTPGLNLELSYGRIRDALLPKLVREGGLFASHDPDGHLFVIRTSQKAAPRQQGRDQTRTPRSVQ
jgi:DNA-directed RNA polymerase specialized sigma24 family protein